MDNLEKVVKEKVEPLVNEAMQKFLGVTIKEIPGEISDKIERNPLISFGITSDVKYKAAKKMFKREFLKRLLQNHYGNVSVVAKIAGVDRRSIHRDAKELDINLKKMRRDMVKSEYYRKEAVDNILRDTLDEYRTIINPQRLQKMYKNMGKLSDEISHALPVVEMTWDEAEAEFEKEYFRKALEDSDGNVSEAARKIGLRYETLHRKLKKLGMS